MSTRALRKLHGGQTLPDLPHFDGESDNEEIPQEHLPVSSKKSRKKNKKPALPDVVNPFDLLNNGNESDTKEAQNEEVISGAEISNHPSEKQPTRKKRPKKKKKKKAASTEDVTSTNNEQEDEIEASIREVNQLLGESSPDAKQRHSKSVGSVYKNILNVEHRYLNPNNEMRRIFGSHVVQTNGNHHRRQRNHFVRKSTYLVQAKDTWPQLSKTGLSMDLVDRDEKGQHFIFVHNKEYQKIQFQFLDAVESLNPQTIIDLANLYPYHVDTLLQVSEICKMSEDMQMAADFIERALYVFECAFHPTFSLTQGTARLSYRQQENRAFFIALFRHLNFIGRRGCYRTALEFCKLLLSLDPEDDPLCVLLMIDFFALRSEQYDFLIRLFQEWESHRNLSQLPNFAMSVPLAMFHQTSQDNKDTTSADEMIQKSLIMFPGLLHPLLDKCSIVPDAEVSKHSFFGPEAQLGQPKALEQLIYLYIGRSYSCWKSPEVMAWLEKNVRQVLQRVDEGDPLVDQCKAKRQRIYQGTPINIHRHIMISDIQQAMTALSPDLAHAPVMSYDPLPPTNSVSAYTRPPRPNRAQTSSNPLSLFFQSLLPNFNPEEVADPTHGAVGGDGSNNFREGIAQVMDAMRDLLTNIRPVPPPVENTDNQNEEENDGDQH